MPPNTKVKSIYTATKKQTENKISRKSHTGAVIEPHSAKIFFDARADDTAAAQGAKMYFIG